MVEEVTKTFRGFDVFIIIWSDGQEGVPELPLLEGGAQCSGGGNDDIEGLVSLYLFGLMVRKVCLNCRCGKAEHNVVEEVKKAFRV